MFGGLFSFSNCWGGIVVSLTVIIHRTRSHFLFTAQRIRRSGVGKEERREKEYMFSQE